jgi:ubiquinone/menaquinone biosynthesis C-methylase UbiE
VLDVPCGTGRFTRQLLEAGKHLVNGDISLPMLRAADNVGRATHESGTNKGALIGGVRFDAERLPFPDSSIDLVMSIRFLFHVPREVRVRIMRELGRVSKRYLVIDVRHRYTITTHTKRLSAFLRGKRTPSERYSMKQLAEDLAAAGLKEKSRIFISPMFSEKLVVVCEK